MPERAGCEASKPMHLVAIAWIYVVLMMAVAEALSTQGSVLGALVTFVIYGALPLAVVLYILGAPGRRKRRMAADATPMHSHNAESTGPAPPCDAEPTDRS